MCDLSKERARIDALLSLVLKSDAARACKDTGELADVALEALRAHYGDKCPDECMRKRCEDFAHSAAPIAIQLTGPP